MHRNNTSTAPAEAEQGASNHYHQREGSSASSSSPSSSWSSSSRVFDNAAHGCAQGTTSTSSAQPRNLESSPHSERAAAGGTDDEDPDPYPLWRRTAASTAAEKTPRASSSPGVLASSYLSSSPTSPPTAAPASGALPGRRAAPCQYPACSRYAKYGTMDSTPIACQAHKRAGQYTTNRHGVLLMATRDGDAFRTPAVASNGPCPVRSSTTVSDQSQRRSKSGSSIPSSSRLEATKPSSPSVQGLKRTNRPGLSGGHKYESLASQSRSCLFPGCDARPDYGLPGAARAMYCFSHKKNSMVHIFKEELDLQDSGENTKTATEVVASRKTTASESRIKAAAAAAAAAARIKNKSRVPATTDKNGAKKARRGPKLKEETGNSDGSGEHTSKTSRGNDMRSILIGHNVARGDPSTTTDTEPGTVTKTSSPRTSASAAATTTMPPSPHTSRSAADTSGMAPSAEILLLKQAREAAKKEADAAGSGRRPRAPSRRALEASGRMKDDVAQWMTLEKRAQQTRISAEMREQRKQCKAAGLKYGVVLEAFVGGTAGTAASGAGVGSGGGVSIGGDSSGKEGEARAAEPPRIDAGWQKVSPVVLSTPSIQQQAVKQETTAPVPAGEMP